MASTRRVASRRVPLRRPSSEAEARAARLMGKSIFDFACRIDRGRARELVWSLGRNRATRSDPPFGCVAFPKNDPEVKCARPRGACESLTSRVRCSEPFLMIFSNFFPHGTWCMCTSFSTLAPLHRILALSTQFAGNCGAFRRLVLRLPLSLLSPHVACTHAHSTAMSNATKWVALPSVEFPNFGCSGRRVGEFRVRCP